MEKDSEVNVDQKHKTNPFIENMMIPLGKKRVQLSKLGRDDNVLVNQDTGEVHGTHVTTYRKVDEQKFVKLFTQNIALTFDLGSAGIKAFNVLMFAVQEMAVQKDEVMFDGYVLEKFCEDSKQKLSRATFSRGVRELISAKIIAKTTRQGLFFINPSFVFNGDRIAFTTAIEKEKNN